VNRPSMPDPQPGAQPVDERRLADAVREHHAEHRILPAGLRQRDVDRTDVAVVLWQAGCCDADIALICGVQPSEVPAVLRGERV
jgi:hypothetical protein